MEARIGKKEQWIEKDGGIGVKWDGPERFFNHRSYIYIWNLKQRVLKKV